MALSDKIKKLNMNRFDGKGLPLDYFIKMGFDHPTNYERERGIQRKEHEIMLDHADLKMVLIHKSDGSSTLSIFFRVGKNTDGWLSWVITEQQAELMIKEFPEIYKHLQEHNSDHRD